MRRFAQIGAMSIAAAAVDCCIVISCSGVGLGALPGVAWFVLSACLLVGAFVAWWEGYVIGFVTSLLCCVVYCASPILSARIDHPQLLVTGVVFGAMALSRFRWVLAALLAIVLIAIAHPIAFVELGAPFAVGMGARWTARKLYADLRLPLAQLKPHLGRIGIVVSFLVGYLLLAVFFALIYTALDYSVTGGAFKVTRADAVERTVATAVTQRARLDLPLSLYFSLMMISTAGCNEVTPVSGTAKSLVAAEVIIGMLWFYVYLAFILRMFEGKAS